MKDDDGSKDCVRSKEVVAECVHIPFGIHEVSHLNHLDVSLKLAVQLHRLSYK